MSTTLEPRPVVATRRAVEPAPAVTTRDPRRQAFGLLWFGFSVLPLLTGIDKFLDWMTDWEKYLWHGFPDLFNVTPQHFMWAVGVVEIVGALLVMVAPRFGGYVIAAWLAGIITDLVIYSVAEPDERYWDVALRDFGLLLGALALARLAAVYRAGRRVGADRRFEDARVHEDVYVS